MNVKKIGKKIWGWTKKHSPQILMVLGAGGMILTTIEAVKATPKAMQAIENEKKATGHNHLTTTETVKCAWKYYIPAALTGAASCGCLFGSAKVFTARNAGLMAVADISATTLAEYKRKAKEVVGEVKEKEIQHAADQAAIERAQIPAEMQDGKVLVVDSLSRQAIYTRLEDLKSAVNKMNYLMTTSTEYYVSLNEFYDEAGFEETEMGNVLGWNIANGLIEIDLSEDTHTADGRPARLIRYANKPTYDFY